MQKKMKRKPECGRAVGPHANLNAVGTYANLNAVGGGPWGALPPIKLKF
jgi:hypothetical protein